MITNSYNDSRKDLNKPPVSIQYEEILAGELFNMYDDEYYVVFLILKIHQLLYMHLFLKSMRQIVILKYIG